MTKRPWRANESGSAVSGRDIAVMAGCETAASAALPQRARDQVDSPPAPKGHPLGSTTSQMSAEDAP